MKTCCALVTALLTLLVAAPAASAQSTGLVAAYGFEEGAGTVAADSSGSGNTGTLAGPTSSASGRFGRALQFDGVNDWVTAADSASLDLSVGMTVEAWLRPETGGWRTALIKERPGGLAYALWGSTDTNRPSGEVQLGSAIEARAATAISTNVWTHVATTYDGATLRLYVNGAQVASRAAAGAIQVTSSPLRIGGNAVWGEYFRGLIDEVRVYNRALTAGEIQTDMGTAIVSGDSQAPSAPVLNATLAGNDVHLTWSGATDNVGITGYRVYRDGTLLTTLPAGATSYDDLDRPYGTYRYTVRAIDAAGNAGAVSNERVVTYADPDAGSPTAPTLTASLTGGDDVHLSWTASSDDLGVAGYRLYRNGGLYRTLSASTLSFDIADESTGTFTYKVVALDAAGHTSPDSNTESVTVTPDTQAPTAPELSATVSGDDVHLTWSAATDERGIAEYVVTRRSDNRTIAMVHASVREHYDLDLPDGTYEYDVRARDKAGNLGPASNVASATVGVPDAEPPTAPTLTASATGRTVTLTWTASSDDKGIAEYSVFRNGTLIAVLGPETRSVPDFNVAYGTHRYTVRALDTAGKSSPLSNEAVVTIEADTTPPTAPVLSATVEDDGVHLSWTESTDEGHGVGSYEVYRLGALFGDRSTRLAGFGADTREYVDRTDLPSETTYRYRVYVNDRAGNRVSSNRVDVRIGEPDLEPPTAPVLSFTGAGLSWTAATDDHTIMEYAIYVDGRAVQVHSPQTLEDRNLSLAPGNRVKITATDTAFKVSESNEVVIDYSPVLSFTKPDGNDVKLTWTAPNVASAYRVYRDGSLVDTRGGTSPREFSESNLAPGTYRYKVQSTDTANRIWDSNVVEVVITEDTSPPTASLSMACGATVHDYVDVRGTTSDDRGPITWHAEVDGEPVTQPSTTLTNGGPFRFEWETRDFSNGPHDMTLVLRDGAGNETVTEPCRWNVHNPVVTVPFAGLADGDTVSGVVKVTAVPHGDGEPLPAGWPVTGVAFGGALGGFDSTGPYETTWDTTKVANGVYTLTAAVQWMDYSLPRATNSIQVRVENAPPSVVDITSHEDGDVIEGTVTFAGDVLLDGQPLEREGLQVRWDITPAGGGTGSSGIDTARPFEHTFGTGMAPDGLYDVKATATWADGGGPVSKTIQVRVKNAPPAPTGLRAEVRQDDVDMLWDVTPGAASYNIYRDGTRIGTTTATVFTDADRPAGTYRYTVRGQKFNAEGEPSQEVTARVAGGTPAGLVAAYGFEHSAGTTAADSSGKGSTGTISGATSVAGGKFGRALSFDGSDDMVTAADSSALDLQPGMTLSAWVRPVTVNDWRTVLLKERPGQLAYALYAATDDGRPMAEIAVSGNRDARGTTALPVGVWSHLAATYDGTTLRLFVNGAQVASGAATGTLFNSAGALRIGGNAVWGEYFSGLIDEVRVYERALSAAEIAADRDRAVVPGT